MPRSSDDAASFGRERLPEEQLDKLCYGRVIYGNLRKHGRPVEKPHYAIILNTNEQIARIKLNQNPTYAVICISHSTESQFLLDAPIWTTLTGKIQGEWQTDIEEAGILKIGPQLKVTEMIAVQELIRRVDTEKKKNSIQS